jgi:hypothetical protein
MYCQTIYVQIRVDADSVAFASIDIERENYVPNHIIIESRSQRFSFDPLIDHNTLREESLHSIITFFF